MSKRQSRSAKKVHAPKLISKTFVIGCFHGPPPPDPNIVRVIGPGSGPNPFRVRRVYRAGGPPDGAPLTVAEALDLANVVQGRTIRTATPPDLTIYRLGERSYRVGASQPVYVTDDEDTALATFLGRPTMDTSALKLKSGLENPQRVLRSLTEKYAGLFASAIRRPGKKGRGGYYALVKPLDSPS